MAFQLRVYQQNIVYSIQNENAIIKMPTGSGKTFVAAELLRQRLDTFPTKKAVFFVPTIDLVEQQSIAVEKWLGTGEIVARFHGGQSPPIMSMHRILVSTPSAFMSLQENQTILDWNHFCICIFDEVHHVLKDHPYRKIAATILTFLQTSKGSLQIIGLSASLTYAVVEKTIETALKRLCLDLCITKMCSPTTKDLLAGGYVPKNGSIEIIDGKWKPDGVSPEWGREPHEMHEIFFTRIKGRQSTHFALLLYDVIILMENHAESICPKFKSPLEYPKLSIWAEYVHNLKGKNRDHFEFFQQLEDLYTGLKLLVVTWEEEEPLTMQWLLLTNATKTLPGYDSQLVALLETLYILSSNKLHHMKLSVLIGQLCEKKARFGNTFRCIIFVQQRISAYILAHFINHTEREMKIGMKAGYIAAKGSKITPSLKVTPTHTKTALQNFRDGVINILIATSVAEEVSIIH
jgi:ERCC4-related helicase